MRWENDAKVAVQIVVNYEEGSEKTFAMGDGVNDIFYELPVRARGPARPRGRVDVRVRLARRDLAAVPRLRRAPAIPVTFFAAAVALERNPTVAEKLARRGDEAAGHGYRWSNHFEMNRDEEREAIRRAVESIERTTGTRPLGWYCREMSVNTRELVVEEGGFLYDSDCYNDDLPYWTRGARPAAPGRALRARRQRRALRRPAAASAAPSTSSRWRRRTSTACATTATTCRG